MFFKLSLSMAGVLQTKLLYSFDHLIRHDDGPYISKMSDYSSTLPTKQLEIYLTLYGP